MIFNRYNKNLWGPLFVGAPGRLPTLPSPKSGPVCNWLYMHLVPGNDVRRIPSEQNIIIGGYIPVVRTITVTALSVIFKFH